MYRTENKKRFSVEADFIAQLCGRACETVLYDVIHTENSVLIAHNDEIGQGQSDLICDIAQKLIDERIYDTQDYVINYDPDNSGRLISVLFIKEEDKLTGVLCINKDTTAVTRLISDFEAFLDINNLRSIDENKEITEIADKNDIDLLLHNMVKSEIENTGVHPMRLTLNEKVELVHKLKEKGVLMISGAITEIAEQLMVSEPSIYRYLSRFD